MQTAKRSELVIPLTHSGASIAAAMVVVAVGWAAATPFTKWHPHVVKRVGHALVGPFQRLLENLDPKPSAFTEKDISPHHWRNGRPPQTPSGTKSWKTITTAIGG